MEKKTIRLILRTLFLISNTFLTYSTAKAECQDEIKSAAPEGAALLLLPVRKDITEDRIRLFKGLECNPPVHVRQQQQRVPGPDAEHLPHLLGHHDLPLRPQLHRGQILSLRHSRLVHRSSLLRLSVGIVTDFLRFVNRDCPSCQPDASLLQYRQNGRRRPPCSLIPSPAQSWTPCRRAC